MKMETEQVFCGLRALWKEIDKRAYRNIEGLKAEITEDEYWEMLEILPPLKHNAASFFMCEFLTGDLTTQFWKEEGKYYAMVVDFRKSFPKMGDEEYGLIRRGCY
jgi:hypothetical protein|tara:strand:- start:911 stop:1225 length:315 start_codon:yes stop_codon:yes gene_type:complete